MEISKNFLCKISHWEIIMQKETIAFGKSKTKLGLET